ncbi:MAG: phosphatase PAP2 family protein [Bacteroidales bacterium]|nr:phosphatase PAP2 family protein [Bacteroidales bacterium]
MEGATEMTVLQYMHHLDQSVTLAINSLNSGFSDKVWMFFSEQLVWYPMYAVIAFFLFRKLGWKRGLICAVACALTVVACDQIGNVVKDAVERLRPCWDLNMVNGGLHILEDKGGKYGFYSAHAANSLGFAVCSILCFKNNRSLDVRIYSVCIWIWALLVGISRVFVGKHFFGDVCAGFIVGAFFGYAFAKMASIVCERLGLNS